MTSTAIAPTGSQTVSASLAARYLTIMVMSTLISGAVIAGYLQYLYLAGLLPPVPITGSIALDEKMAFVRDSLHGDFDIIAAGSSMAMNNLSSDAFLQEASQPKRVLNIGSWGLKISASRRWLNHVLKYVHVQKVILVTGPMDFSAQGLLLNNVSDSDLDTFLTKGPGYPLLLVQKFSLPYYARPMANHRQRRDDYDSLQFDSGGAVPFEIYYPNVRLDRWNGRLDPGFFALLIDNEYDHLALMAKDLRSRGVDLVVIRALMRSHVQSSGGAQLEEHWDRVKRIVTEGKQRYLDLSGELLLDDSYFADYAHLNAKGAFVFSRSIAQHLQ